MMLKCGGGVYMCVYDGEQVKERERVEAKQSVILYLDFNGGGIGKKSKKVSAAVVEEVFPSHVMSGDPLEVDLPGKRGSSSS